MTLRLHQPTLVVIDVQNAIDDPRWGRRNNPDAEVVINRLLTAFREHRLPVLHIRHDSTDPDSAYRPGQPGNEFKAAARPAPGETVISKTTNNAFIGTDLAERLHTAGGDVVYAGVITNNSLEATVRMSGNLGISSFVAADACWTVDKTDLNDRVWPAEEVHALSLANLHNEYATVITAPEILAALP
jgi:nicotinamidase-related amidase